VIRYINCCRKLPELSNDDFRDYWQGAEFSELVRKVAQLTNASHHEKNLTLKVDMGRHLIEDRGLGEPYDGIIEYSWENAGHLASIYSTEEAQALLQQMQRFQSQFIDLKNSTAFFTEHQTA
jgi:hypothetical protein